LIEGLLEPLDPARVLGRDAVARVLRQRAHELRRRRLPPALRAPGSPPADPVGEDGERVRVDGEEFVARVFKLQANLDQRHRDRTAYARVLAGRFERGMSVTHLRTGRALKLARAHTLFADERATVDEAFPATSWGS
jgi:peptide chain release factor 3